MKRIAIITGASSGMGKRFAETLSQNVTVDEVWLIARRGDRLSLIAETLDVNTRIFPYDLTDREKLFAIDAVLKEEKPVVSLLINCAGYGKFEKTTSSPVAECLNMIDLNCSALSAMCRMCLDYTEKGSKIINIASVASCQPIPYINIYGATKAYVLSFSRALNREVKPGGVTVTAVLPYWTRTEFFDRAVTSKEAVVKKYVVMYEASDIVDRAWKSALKGKDCAKYGFISRSQMLLCKLLPHSIIMSIWMKQQKL